MSWGQVGRYASRTVCVSLLLGCSSSGDGPNLSRGQTQAPVSPTAVAMVGGISVQPDTVRRIAKAQGISPRAALELAVSDTLLASEFERRGDGASISVVRRATQSRMLLEELQRASLGRGEPTAEELAEATARHWWDYDRPVMVRTAHAVVQEGTPEQRRALALKIFAALQGVKDPAQFIAQANTVPAGDLTVTVQSLPPVGLDGRTYDPSAPPRPGAPPGQFDTDYAAAAHAIENVGDLSPIVETIFGLHVIVLTERIEARATSVEKRRKDFRSEILRLRSETDLKKTLATAREASPPSFDRAWNGYLDMVDVTSGFR